VRRALALVAALAACGGGKKQAGGADAGGADATVVDDCEVAVAHMQKVAPELVVGDATDLAECRKLPPELVKCLQGIADAAGAERCVEAELARGGYGPPPLDAGAAAPPKPVEMASRELCARLVEHYAGLLPEDQRDEWPKASMLASCPSEVTRSEAECVIAAKRFDDAEACLGE
jgi:hypothetical protein